MYNRLSGKVKPNFLKSRLLSKFDCHAEQSARAKLVKTPFFVQLRFSSANYGYLWVGEATFGLFGIETRVALAPAPISSCLDLR